jgi:hypothetical protein
MAAYDPPQPLWKRNLAGVLDFLLVFCVFGYLLFKIFGGGPPSPIAQAPGTTELISLGPWSMLMLLVLIIAYFVILGRTGGTIFQRVFHMKRVR